MDIERITLSQATGGQDIQDHCVKCETWEEDPRCPDCGMTGHEIAAKRQGVET